MNGVKCPKCWGVVSDRIPRRGWMRWIPTAKAYRCDMCRQHLLVVGGIRLKVE
jgi:hypothetical protein